MKLRGWTLGLILMAVVAGCGTAPGEDPAGTEGAPAAGEIDEQAITAPDGGVPARRCTGSRDCSPGTYCKTGSSGLCPSFATPGVCAVKPLVCTLIHDPVVACDGRRYPSPCAAAASGAAVASKPPADPDPIPTPLPLPGPFPR